MIEHTIQIEAPPDVVWRFFTDPALLARWLGPADLDPTPGGELAFHLADPRGPVVRGRFIELRPYEKIVFTFGWDPIPGVPDLPPGSSQVEVTLSAQGDGTLLTLRHSSVPPDLVETTYTGWAGFLTTLKAEVATHNRSTAPTASHRSAPDSYVFSPGPEASATQAPPSR